MSQDTKQALIWFDPFTSNLFRKGKVACWKVVETSNRYVEEYVCFSTDSVKKVDEVRYDIFHRRISSQYKIIDLSRLSPCESVFKLHSSRANFVAKISLRSSVEVTRYFSSGVDG